MSENPPNITFSGGLMMSNAGSSEDTDNLEIESDHIGTVEPQIEWIKDYEEDEVTYWPQLVINTEFGTYYISLVDRRRNMESLAAWMLDELKKGPDNRTKK